MGMLLIMLLTGCISTTEVVYKPYVPVLDFPIFPDLEGEERNADNTVTVPGEWIIRMQEFHIYYEELEKDYNDIKALYEKLYKE